MLSKDQVSLRHSMTTQMKSTYWLPFVLVAVAAIITGCDRATFRSTRVDLSSRSYNAETNHVGDYGLREGMPYCLPKGYIHLLAELQSGPGVAAGKGSSANTNSTGTHAAAPAGASSADASYYKLTVDVTIVPDGSNLFLLQPRLSAWAHDTQGITIQNGLLTSV